MIQESEYLTISHTAQILNVTKQTIYNQIKSDDIKKFIKIVNDVKYISKYGIELIQSKLKFIGQNDLNFNYLSSKNPNQIDSNLTTLINTQKELTNTLHMQIDDLKRQLLVKDSHIDVKDRQIQDLNEQLKNKDRLFENMQILLKDSQNNILLLQQVKKSFWDKFFNKNKE